MSVQFHNPSIRCQKHPLGCILQSIFIILRPNIKTNLTDYHIFFLQFHTWFSHSQDIWLCFSYILRGVLPKVNFPRRHSHLYWFVNSREPLQTGPADSELTSSFKSYRNGATQSKTERPLSLALAAWLSIHNVGESVIL